MLQSGVVKRYNLETKVAVIKGGERCYAEVSITEYTLNLKKKSCLVCITSQIVVSSILKNYNAQ
jgi:hypothetical protein